MLDSMAKSASAPFPHAPQYLPGRVPMPLDQQSAAPTGDAGGKGWTWGDTGELAMDMAAGSNPFTGVPYYGYKAINNFSKGNIWSGIGDVGWGALSFLPGVTSAAKGFFGGASRLAAKATPGFVRSMQTGKAVQQSGMAGKVLGGGLAAGVGGVAGGAMTGEGGQPPPSPAPYIAAPSSPPPAGSFIEQATQDIRRRGLSTTSYGNNPFGPNPHPHLR